MSILVYRIEKKDTGKGPWCSYEPRPDGWRDMAWRMPPPFEDGIPVYYGFSEYRHGCVSLSQLHNWFGAFVDYLKNKFCIRVYRTSRYLVGGHQVVFDANSSVLLEEKSVEALLEVE